MVRGAGMEAGWIRPREASQDGTSSRVAGEVFGTEINGYWVGAGSLAALRRAAPGEHRERRHDSALLALSNLDRLWLKLGRLRDDVRD